jgi:uncharacterized protein (DUF58 family)
MSALLRWLDPILNPLACLPSIQVTKPEQDAESLLRRLDTLLRQKLKYAMAGEQKGLLKGQGLDFADLREYTPGDDIRKMDWSVFARTLMPHIREYHEEKQLTLWLAIDLTPSMRFGKTSTKIQTAIELAGLFGLLSERAGHKLGAYLITGQKPEIIPPSSNPAHLRHILQRLLKLNETPLTTTPFNPDPLGSACQQLCHLAGKQNTVIFLSDFLASSQNWQAPLGQLSHKVKLLSLMLIDPIETALPKQVGLLTLQDPETGLSCSLDTNDSSLHQAYQHKAQQQQEQNLHCLKDFGNAAFASTDQDALDILLALLKTGSVNV